MIKTIKFYLATSAITLLSWIDRKYEKKLWEVITATAPTDEALFLYTKHYLNKLGMDLVLKSDLPTYAMPDNNSSTFLQ